MADKNVKNKSGRNKLDNLETVFPSHDLSFSDAATVQFYIRGQMSNPTKTFSGSIVKVFLKSNKNYLELEIKQNFYRVNAMNNFVIL